MMEPPKDEPVPTRRIDHEYSVSLAAFLAQHGVSLLITTYEAGKVVLASPSADGRELDLTYRNLTSPMGVAVQLDGGSIAVAIQDQVWQFRNVPALAPHIEPRGAYDACYLPRQSIYSGPIDAHEMAWTGGDLWVVNTLFSCLCTFDGIHNFVPRWKPRFISALAAEDRCHLNGFGLVGGRPAYVTALGETDTKEGWRSGKAAGGCLIDIATGLPIARGLSMPHSPRAVAGGILLLESGRGRIVRVNQSDGAVEPIAEVPGYARGLSFVGGYAFVGLSRFRKSSTSGTFGGLPISERSTPLTCGVSVVDLAAGKEVARLEFHAGIDEIFDVQPLPFRHPWLSGPHTQLDEVRPIWVVPDPRALELPGAQRTEAI
jgi:uncharacterized protein (TIGR03032 family)